MEKIELCESDTSRLFSDISKFFQNGYEQNALFGGSRQSVVFNAAYQGKETFKRLIDQQFSNICILLSYLDLDEKSFSSYINPMTEFLRYIKFSEVSDGLKYLNIFFNKKAHLFNLKSINELLAIIYDNYGLHTSFYTLLKFSTEETKIGFVDVNSINFHVTNFSSTNLYPLLNNQQQKDYRESLKAAIENESGTYYLYFDAIDNNIITEPEFIKKYKDDINSVLNLKIDNASRNLIHCNHQIHLFLALYLEDKIDLSFIELKKISYKYYQFLFDLNNYPEDEFELAWLKFRRPQIIDDYISNVDYSNVDYVYDKIEKYLLENDDTDYEHIYFQFKKRRSL